uniref:Uncharacterized protein n=1 Tax=Moniliophthora roreri TaxID=221103 RepID=A0A0W0FXC1_MONRR
MGDMCSYFPPREGNGFLQPGFGEGLSPQPQTQRNYAEIEFTSDIYAQLTTTQMQRLSSMATRGLRKLTDHGCFVYLFNIFLPSDDPRNRTTCLPPSFESLKLSSLSIADPNQYHSGALVCNPESEIQREPLRLHDFHLHDRPYVEDTKSTPAKSAMATDSPPALLKAHSSFFLKVVQAKTHNVAAFSGAKPNTISLEFAPHNRTVTKYWFRNQKYMASRSGPVKDSMAETRNQCGFVRSIRVTVRSHVKDMEGERTYIMGDYMVTTTRIPTKHLPHHPSAVINDFLLKQCPEAEITLTHDQDWFALLEDGEDTLPNDAELLRRLREKFTLTVRDGVVRVLRTASS